jgi:hypothetical protein
MIAFHNIIRAIATVLPDMVLEIPSCVVDSVYSRTIALSLSFRDTYDTC